MRPGKISDGLLVTMALLTALFLAAVYAQYLHGAHQPEGHRHYLIGRDFVNTWMGGRAVLSGNVHQLFNHDVYLKYLHTVFPELPWHNWSYPPDILLFIWPLSLLPYLWGYIAWIAAGLAALLWSARATRLSAVGTFFLLAAPAVVINLFAGQNAFFTAALIIGALTNLDRRPVIAGILIGLLTLKPQLGLLFPLALIASRRWRVFMSASITTIALVAITALVFGISAWRNYLIEVMPYQTQILEHLPGFFRTMMSTPFMNARLLGLSPSVAYAIQAAFALVAIAAVYWTFKSRRDPVLSNAILVTAGFIATPYVLHYDLVVLGLLLWKVRDRFRGPFDMLLIAVAYELPIIAMSMGAFHIPGSCLILPALMLRLVHKLRFASPETAASAPQPIAMLAKS